MSLYQKTLANYEEGFFGYIPIGVIVQSCIGSVAAMYVLSNGNSIGQMLQLLLVVATCMVYNGAVLSNQKPRIVFHTLAISIVVNTIVAIINMVL